MVPPPIEEFRQLLHEAKELDYLAFYDEDSDSLLDELPDSETLGERVVKIIQLKDQHSESDFNSVFMSSSDMTKELKKSGYDKDAIPLIIQALSKIFPYVPSEAISKRTNQTGTDAQKKKDVVEDEDEKKDVDSLIEGTDNNLFSPKQLGKALQNLKEAISITKG